jgi:hypothetical protein
MVRSSKIALLIVAGMGLAGSAQAQPPGGGGPGGGGPGGGMNMLAIADADKDGKVSLAEYGAFQAARWGRIAQGADKVTVASLNPMQQSAFSGIAPAADGTVGKAAFEAAVPAKFKAADKNGDGGLDQQELMASVMPMGGMGRPPAQ